MLRLIGLNNTSSWQAQEVRISNAVDKDLNEPIVKETFTTTRNGIHGFKFDGAGTKESQMMSLIDMLLANSQAGLIDIDLNLSRKCLMRFIPFCNERSQHTLLVWHSQRRTNFGRGKGLVTAEVEKIKAGDFDDWLLEAVINDLKLSQFRDWRAIEIEPLQWLTPSLMSWILLM